MRGPITLCLACIRGEIDHVKISSCSHKHATYRVAVRLDVGMQLWCVSAGVFV